MDELLSEFVAETQESLEALANVVVALESDPSDRSLLDELFRFFHTVKGSSGFLDLPRFERLSHAAEDVLSEIRAGDAAPDSATISAVLAVMDRIAELCLAIEQGHALSDADDEGLIATLRAAPVSAAAPVPGKGAAGAPDEERGDREAPVAGEAGPAADEGECPEAAGRSAGVARTIRLPIALIDQLMNGVSDMVLARNELARTLRASGVEPEVDNAFERLSVCIADMRDTISKTRMQRVDRLFMAIPRMVRDLGRALGKTVDVTIEGGDVEMDREMVETVVDPLTHIVRNSISHGIETPDQRREAGKPEIGRLRVSASQSGSQIVIEVADDGRGVDVDAVVARVLAGGLMTAQDIARMSDQEKLALIFLPGLTTASEVTAVSGRGVGMDVVRANVERIGGVIALESAPGQGLTVTLRVPLTLTIIPGLILNAGGLDFAIPRSAVIEILHDTNRSVRIDRLGGGLTATIRGMRYSMIDLETVIGLPRIEQSGPRALMLVRSAAGRPYILGVAHVENHEELVVRPAAPVVMTAGIYAGMTLPDNGQPMLLLDAGGVAQVARLPLIAEPVEGWEAEATAEPDGPATYAGLRFVDLGGEERVIRLSLVERVEDVPLRCFGESAGRPFAAIGGNLVACVHRVGPEHASADDGTITCLRIRDDMREICYPVRAVVDIGDVPERLDMSARHGLVAGLVLLEGQQVEVVDSLALLALAGEEKPEPQRAKRCIIPDGEDRWNREILAPLLSQAGYEVVWGLEGAPPGATDVLLLTSSAMPDALADEAGVPAVRLRRTSRPVGPDDASVYRYDQDALLERLSALGGREAAA